MAHLARLVAFFFFVALTACGQRPGPGPSSDAGTAADAGSTTDAGSGTDGGLEANIGDVLGCTPPLGVNGTANPGELQLHVVDTVQFPDALCNDGSPAILYYRPARGAANRTKWLISMRGGGGCGSASVCAARWCSCSDAHPCAYATLRSIFTANNMSGSGRRGEAGGGIDGRDPAHPSPFDDYNQVQLHYCSSDGWRGTAKGVQFTTVHPRRGDMVTYVLHFLGASVLDADLATLQQDNVAPLQYTLGGGSVAMPDLDEATEVVLAGDSGGGAGVIQRLDAVAERLRASHVGGSAPEIFGIIDAVAGPDQSRLNFTHSSYATTNMLDTYDKIMAVVASGPANQGSKVDDSCLAYHAPRGSAGWCFDETHVLRHHLTTPFFYRMALLDSTISTSYVTDDIRDPDRGDRTFKNDIGFFGIVMHEELKDFGALPNIMTADHDRGTVAPGVFAPACGYHDTLHATDQTFGTTITPANGTAKTFLEIYGAWRANPNSPDARLLTESTTRADTVCP